jgi:hypothetical protein
MRPQITTTLNKIRAQDPCADGWRKLLAHLDKTEADDEPLPLSVIVESNGLEDALWALRTLPEHNNLWRQYAVWCARQVQHLMTDERSIAALDVAERHSRGEVTDEELTSAWAASTASTASAAASTASAAASAAAWAAASDAARTAARTAARAAASFGAWAAASDAARAAALDAQKTQFLKIVE